MTQKYARIVDGTVFETLETDLDIADLFSPDLVWVACSVSVEQGYTYNGTNFAPPVPVTPPAPPAVKPTPREWLERLSSDKQNAISAAAVANPAIFLWLLKAAGSSVIDVSLTETQQGVAALVAAGVLTADDEAVLLAP